MNEFKQGARVADQQGNKGVIVGMDGEDCRIGFDNPKMRYGNLMSDFVIIIPPSPAISTLPQAQREIMQSLHEKRTTEGQHEAHETLREYGYITQECKLTPYGDYMVRRWVEAGMPVDEPASVVEAPALKEIIFTVGKNKFNLLQDGSTMAVIEAQESTPPDAIKQPETGQLNQVLPPDTVSLFAEHDMAKKLAELEAENERLKDANARFAESLRIKNEELQKAHETIERQKQELIDAKTKRLSVKPVSNGIERILSTIECEVNGEYGTLYQKFLPALEQPKAAPSEISIPQIILNDLDAMIENLAPADKAAAKHRMGATVVALNVLWEEFNFKWEGKESA